MKKIIRLTVNDNTYEIGETPMHMEDVVVTDISFKRDGYQGIFKGRDEEHYLIRIKDATTEDVEFKLIPASQMIELSFIEITEEKEKKEECEITTNDPTTV